MALLKGQPCIMNAQIPRTQSNTVFPLLLIARVIHHWTFPWSQSVVKQKGFIAKAVAITAPQRAGSAQGKNLTAVSPALGKEAMSVSSQRSEPLSAADPPALQVAIRLPAYREATPPNPDNAM